MRKMSISVLYCLFIELVLLSCLGQMSNTETQVIKNKIQLNMRVNYFLKGGLKLKSIIGLFITLLLTSCDPLHTIGISNESGHDIEVQITFNENSPNYHGLNFFMENYHSYKTPLAADTLANMCRYSVAPKEYFVLYDKINKSPDFSEFEELIIITGKDSLIYTGRENIKKAFLQTGKNRWELIEK